MLRQLIAMLIGTLLLIIGAVYCWPAQARSAEGVLVVDNQRIATVVISVDGRRLGQLPPEGEARFRLPAGEHSLRASLLEGGPVLHRTVRVRPHQESSLVVPAFEGRLVVRNQTGRSGRLRLDGRDRGPLSSGAERVLVLDPGVVSVQLVQADRVLMSQRATVRSGQRALLEARAPSVADLRLRNPLPIPVIVQVEGREARRLGVGESLVLQGMSTGPARIEVRQLNGRAVARGTVQVDPFDGAAFVVPLPQQGPMRLVNLGNRSVDLYVDGRRVGSCAPRQQTEIMLAIGERELVLRDRGGDRLLRTSVQVEPFEAVTLRCDLQRHFLVQERELLAELEDLVVALRRLAS